MTDQSRLVQAAEPVRLARTVAALILREMSTTYGRNVIGYLWAIIEPAAGILLLSLVFAAAFRVPPIGTSFAIFYASGLLPFLAYLDISQKLAQSLRFSKQLLAYPGVTFIDALLARLILNALAQLMVFVTVLGGILLIFDVDVILVGEDLLLAAAMLIVLAAGVGTFNCFAMSVFPTWERVWAILNRPMLLISCVLFDFESVPEPYRDYLWFNPLVHVIGKLRAGIYPTYRDDYVSPVFVFAVGATLLALGLALLRRYHSDILNR
ncbi:ABC transporter permease [Albidovulum sp.]